MSTPVKIKKEKIDTVKSVADEIVGKDLIFVDYAGINFTDLSVIRKGLRENQGQVRVAKNTLIKIALAEKNIKPPDEVFTGMSALAIIGGDFSASSKILLDAEKTDKVRIKGGYYEGQIVDKAFVKKIANVPNRETLLSMLVGVLQAPLSQLVAALNGVSEKKAAGAPAPAAPEAVAPAAETPVT